MLATFRPAVECEVLGMESHLPLAFRVRGTPWPHNHSYSCPMPKRTPKTRPFTPTRYSKALAPTQL